MNVPPNNHLRHSLFWVMLVITILMLAGCVRRKPATTNLPTQVGSLLPTPITASMPTPTATRALAPSTPTPPAASSQATVIPTTAGPTPTPDLERYNRQSWSDSSPYGPWQADFWVAYPEGENGASLGDQYYVRVQVANLETGQVDTVIDAWRPYGLGFTIPQSLLWSNDGGYLFLAETGNSDGSGERFYDQLERFDLASATLSALNLPGGPGESISPDGRWLARIDGENLVLIEIDGSHQEQLNFDVPRSEWRADQLFWSPQGDSILFSVRLNPFAPLEEMRSNLYLADRTGGEIKTLIADDRRRFSIASFPEQTAALLSDLEARQWWLSLPDGTVSSDPPQDIAQASQAIGAFFRALQTGLYKEAAQWYGGSLEPLQALNPETPPEDIAKLLEQACTTNGYHCLAIDSLLLEQVTAAGKYLFEVSFTQADGNLFVLNPCCENGFEAQPPAWLFQYAVEQDANGRYRVLELPIYAP